METILLIAILLLLIIALFFIIIGSKRNSIEEISTLKTKLELIETGTQRIESSVKDEVRLSRVELADLLKANREEHGKSLNDFRGAFSDSLIKISETNQKALEKLNGTLEERITALIDKSDQSNKTNREELAKNLKDFGESNSLHLEKINKQVEEKLSALTEQAKIDNSQMREALVRAC